jgi:hypothetical protein
MCSCPTFDALKKDCTNCDAVSFCDLSKWLAKYKEILPFPENPHRHPTPIPDDVKEAIETNVFGMTFDDIKKNFP